MELDGPGSWKIKGIVAGGCREDCPDAVGNVIGYSEPGPASCGVSWVSRVAGGIENPSRNVDMGFREQDSSASTTAESKLQTRWNLDNSAKSQERLKTTRAEQVAATHARLQRSGADRGGDPGVGYGPRRECKFDPANQKDDESPVAENRGHRRSPPPEIPKAVDIFPVCSKGLSKMPTGLARLLPAQPMRQDRQKESKRPTVDSGVKKFHPARPWFVIVLTRIAVSI